MWKEGSVFQLNLLYLIRRYGESSGKDCSELYGDADVSMRGPHSVPRNSTREIIIFSNSMAKKSRFPAPRPSSAAPSQSQVRSDLIPPRTVDARRLCRCLGVQKLNQQGMRACHQEAGHERQRGTLSLRAPSETPAKHMTRTSCHTDRGAISINPKSVAGGPTSNVSF